MKVRFRLFWSQKKSRQHPFASPGLAAAYEDYTERIGRFTDFATAGPLVREDLGAGSRLWICHGGAGSKTLSSEALAAALRDLENRGVRELHVAIGPPDGFSPDDLVSLRPDLLIGFGPMTYPHELAAVIAAEQLYRAYTILARLPYHSGH